MFTADFPKTSAELSKPNKEIVTMYRINTSSSGLFDSEKTIHLNSLDFSKYFNLLGTRLTVKHNSLLETSVKNINTPSKEGFYNYNYDLIALTTNRKTISIKIKIKSISKYSPKIVL